MNEGARWFRAACRCDGDCGFVWVLFPSSAAAPAGMVFRRSDVGWCAHTPGTVQEHTRLGFVDAVAIVEQAATNALDATSPALKL